MSDSLEMLRQRVGPAERHSGKTAAGAEPALDEDECPAFGFLRGVRERAVALEFRCLNGNRRSFPYSWLGPVDYNPSAGILLKFVGDLVYLVLIEGSNLNALVGGSVTLYDRGLLRQRITWVREMTRRQGEAAAPDAVFVERFRFLRHRPDENPPEADWLTPFAAPA